MLDFEAFKVAVAEVLALSPDDCMPNRSFIGDLGCDSLALAQLALLMEDWGVAVSESMLRDIDSIDDAYHYYSAATNDPNSVSAVRPVGLAGRWSSMRPVSAADSQYLYSLATHPEVGSHWRFRGSTPSPEEFVRVLWHKTFLQYIVTRRDNPEPLGLVTLYNADFRNSFAYLSVILDPRLHGNGWGIEAIALFLEQAFNNWAFNKIYAEMVSTSLTRYKSTLGDLFVEEGRLIGHETYGSRREDLVILALYASRWKVHRLRALATGNGSSS